MKVEQLSQLNTKLNVDLTETTELTEQLTVALDDYEEASELIRNQQGAPTGQ